MTGIFVFELTLFPSHHELEVFEILNLHPCLRPILLNGSLKYPEYPLEIIVKYIFDIGLFWLSNKPLKSISYEDVTSHYYLVLLICDRILYEILRVDFFLLIW